jgi:RNAse (barnase) inhibitor barstar
MIECVIRAGNVRTPEDFYEFFAATRSVVPDYGGRNLDALLDDLGDIGEDVAVVIRGLEVVQPALGDWTDRLVGTLVAAISRSNGRLTLTFAAP